jgi:hypothetical protein
MGWFKRAVAMRLGITFVVGYTAGAILAAGSASAAVTIGSNLQHEPNQSFNCSDLNRCTVMLSALEPARQAPGGVVSPIDGVLVSWSIRVAAPSEPIEFRVIRPTGAGSFVGVGSLPTVTPPEYATTTYPARVAVRAGDGIGINCCQMGNARFWHDAGFNPVGEPFFAPNGSTYLFWNPILPDGGPLPPTATQGPEQYETAIQATIEPDCDQDGLFDETQDSNLSTCGPNDTTPTGSPPTLPNGAPATCEGTPATIVGTKGSDVRTASQGQDVIVALGGNDTLSGLDGNDVICGGAGKDTLKGGKGNDILLGQKGKEALRGGRGEDLCKGGKGKDTASGCETEKSI